MKKPSAIPRLLGVTLSLGLALSAQAAPLHISNGLYDALEWTAAPNSTVPARSTVSITPFKVGGVNPGAELLVEQSVNGAPPAGALGNRLNLGYDCLICDTVPAAGSTFDIFFESGDEDYAVRVTSTGGSFDFAAFEKDRGVPTPLNPNGSLDLSSPVWSGLSPADLALAQFVIGASFGGTPFSSAPHLFVEFELSVDTSGASTSAGTPPNGLYRPEPAFWSASINTGPSGPGFIPLSSAFFTLRNDGTVSVAPVLGPNGEAIVAQAVPEPGVLALLLGGMAAMGSLVRRGRQGTWRRGAGLAQG
ncbi:MAG: PEP-CTERM sorting domain-containing protein [Pseudomonadota bacterium]